MDLSVTKTFPWTGKLSSFMKTLVPRTWFGMGNSKTTLDMVAMLPEGADRQLVESAARESEVPIRVINRLDSSLPGSDFPIPAVILFDRDLPASDWRTAFMAFKNWYPRPYVILLSKKSDLNLWDELQRVGGSDILRTPLTHERLLWAINRACSIWQHRQEVRRPLEYRV